MIVTLYLSDQIKKKRSAIDRVDFLKKKQRLCFNWSSNQYVKNCASKFSCWKCCKKYYSLIHFHKTNKNSLIVYKNNKINVSEITISSELYFNALIFERNNENMSENTPFIGANYKQNFKLARYREKKSFPFKFICIHFCRLQ